MNIQLINGQFNTQDALDLLTQFIQVKVNFHESKIIGAASEEDIKARERRIKELQADLSTLRHYVKQEGSTSVHLQTDIVLTLPTVVNS